MEKDEPSSALPECPSSTSAIDTIPADTRITINQRPSLRGNIRYVIAAYELLESEVDASEADCQSTLESVTDGELSPAVSPRSGGSLDPAHDVCNQGGSMKEAQGVLQSEDFAAAADEDKEGLIRRELDVGEVREIAVQALAAIPQEDQNVPHPSTPLRQGSSPELIPTSQLSSSPPTMSPPRSQARSPLRSPCWRTLVPVTPPPEGYWAPNATVKGEKNTPMCPPCKSGKKGRCFGGLPCDRCREKGYIKERCEGSLMFQFRPKKKIARDQTEAGSKKGSPVDGGRWRRDSFGRFT
jgi:hypothetical protein